MSPLPVSPEPSPRRLTTRQVLTEERFDGAAGRSINGPEHRLAADRATRSSSDSDVSSSPWAPASRALRGRWIEAMEDFAEPCRPGQAGKGQAVAAEQARRHQIASFHPDRAMLVPHQATFARSLSRAQG